MKKIFLSAGLVLLFLNASVGQEAKRKFDYISFSVLLNTSTLEEKFSPEESFRKDMGAYKKMMNAEEVRQQGEAKSSIDVLKNFGKLGYELVSVSTLQGKGEETKMVFFLKKEL